MYGSLAKSCSSEPQRLAQRGASLAITAELVSVRDDRQLWGEKYNRRAEDVLQVEGEIATTIARTLRRQLSGEEQGEARPRRYC